MYRSAFEHQKTRECQSFTRYKYVGVYATKLKIISNAHRELAYKKICFLKHKKLFRLIFQKVGSTKKHSILTEAVLKKTLPASNKTPDERMAYLLSSSYKKVTKSSSVFV